MHRFDPHWRTHLRSECFGQPVRGLRSAGQSEAHAVPLGQRCARFHRCRSHPADGQAATDPMCRLFHRQSDGFGIAKLQAEDAVFRRRGPDGGAGRCAAQVSDERSVFDFEVHHFQRIMRLTCCFSHQRKHRLANMIYGTPCKARIVRQMRSTVQPVGRQTRSGKGRDPRRRQRLCIHNGKNTRHRRRLRPIQSRDAPGNDRAAQEHEMSGVSRGKVIGKASLPAQ